MRKLQTLPDDVERKPWISGHAYVGKPARRFFAGVGASDGRITGWLPADGADVALWHMVHGDDLDEEDLDETEAEFAIANYADNRAEMTAEEAAYAAQFAAAAADEAEGEADADDGDATDDGDDDAADADDDFVPEGLVIGTRRELRNAREREPAGRSAAAGVFYGSFAKKKLWITAEARERWLGSLNQGTPTCAAVSLAATAFRQHCRAFGVLTDALSDRRRLSRDETDLQLHSWCHMNAFGKAKSVHLKKKKKKKPKGGW